MPTASRTWRSTSSGSFQRRERRALVGADDEDRLAEAPVADGVDGERVLVEHDLVGEIEREPREPQPLLGRRDHLAVARRRRDEHEQPVDRQLLERGPGERDVADLRRVEGAAEDPGRHWNSSTSPSTSTSSPSFAPTSRSARSSSSSEPGVPCTRKPRSVRRIRKRRRWSGFGR